MRPFVMSCLFAIWLATTCNLAALLNGSEPDRAALDVHLPYQARRSDPVTYEVDFRVTVTAPYKTKVLKVWLPLPPSDAAQEASAPTFVTFPLNVAPIIAKESCHGNKFAHFVFHQPEGAQIIEVRFQVKVWELNWDLDVMRLPRVANWPAAFEPYLNGDDQAVVVNEGVRRLAGEIVPRSEGPGLDLARIFAWADANLRYDHGRASLRADARHALEHRTGHCSDYHSLCASLGRTLGYPTRVTYGMHAFPKASPSHCKLEAYLPPHGWVSFDVSETQRMVAAIRKDGGLDPARKDRLAAAAHQRLLRGFRDNTWFLTTRGTDYDLAPPASRKVPVVRTLYAEADGAPLPEPDPASPDQRTFAWMTAHRFQADREVAYPFKDYATLEKRP